MKRIFTKKKQPSVGDVIFIVEKGRFSAGLKPSVWAYFVLKARDDGSVLVAESSNIEGGRTRIYWHPLLFVHAYGGEFVDAIHIKHKR